MVARKLTLKGVASDDPSIVSIQESSAKSVITAPSETSVTLLVNLKPADDVSAATWTKSGGAPTSISVTRFDNDTVVGTVPADGIAGEYTVTATDSDGQAITSNVLEVKVAETVEPGGVADEKVVETAVGEYDGVFAILGLVVFGGIAAAVLALVWKIALGIDLPDAGTVLAKDTEYDGTFNERIRSILILIGGGVGAILLVMGGWLASLEARGRLRTRTREEQQLQTRGISEIAATLSDPVAFANAASKLAKALTRTRGTAAILTLGAILLFVSIGLTLVGPLLP